MPKPYHFQFADHTSSVFIQEKLPSIEELYTSMGYNPAEPPETLVVCDKNTAPLAQKIAPALPLHVLTPGEDHKNWETAEAILRSAGSRGLGRDGLFIGIGGGVVCDVCAFAASIYMRGAVLALVPTTLLCMVDAAVGGKTGFDLEGFKNMAGTFYPAKAIFAAAEALNTLPQNEWKSGMAELIKTAILDPDPATFEQLRKIALNDGISFVNGGISPSALIPFIERAVQVKGNIVSADPKETKSERALLNLGHTFGHALESALGLGAISHGEAVAWGMARSCELGMELGITPPSRAEAIQETLKAFGYETSIGGFFGDSFFDTGDSDKAADRFREALSMDKKKKGGKLRFVAPDAKRAVLIEEDERTKKYISSIVIHPASICPAPSS